MGAASDDDDDMVEEEPDVDEGEDDVVVVTVTVLLWCTVSVVVGANMTIIKLGPFFHAKDQLC